MEEAFQESFFVWYEEEFEDKNDFLNNSAVQKRAEGWLRLMRGDDLVQLSNELCLSPHVLRRWQKRVRKYI